MCGNFAVLVDLHVLPRGSSTDTSWFSDPEKEEVCLLLKDPIDARVKQFVEARKSNGQQKNKEFTQSNPLFLKGTRCRIAAYFMKRWVNLRCILKQQYRGLRVFPYRFVVCTSLQEPALTLTPWTSDSLTMKDSVSGGTSEYFIQRTENGNATVPSATKKQQFILKEIIKKTKTKEQVMEPSARKMPLEPKDSNNHQEKEEIPSNGSLKMQCFRTGQTLDSITTAASSVEPSLPKLEFYANQRQPNESSSQQKPNSGECFKAGTLSRKLPCSSESQVPDGNQNGGAAPAQQKRRRPFSDENLATSKKAAYGRDNCIPTDVKPIQESNVEYPVQTLHPVMCSQSFSIPAPTENALLVQISANSMEQINQIKPLLRPEDVAPVLKVSPVKICRSPDTLIPENLKKVENQPRKLKLQRSKR
ncbi:protein SLX4IP isoform X2 [Lissotriton helveticus]